MERPISFILACLIVISLTACGADTSSPSSVPSSTPVNTSSATTTTSQEPAQTETYPKIRECFSTINENWKIVVHERKNRLEVVLLADDLNSEAAPENWQDILSSMEAAITEAQLLAESAGFSILSAQVELEDGTILTSGYNGSIKFDKFNQVSSQQNKTNPPTISKFEFDQITVGMSLSQVNDIIGGSGTLESSIGTAGVTSVTRTYTWQGDNGGYASILFDDYEVYYKIEVGLS